jgi:hypothetical protein
MEPFPHPGHLVPCWLGWLLASWLRAIESTLSLSRPSPVRYNQVTGREGSSTSCTAPYWCSAVLAVFSSLLREARHSSQSDGHDQDGVDRNDGTSKVPCSTSTSELCRTAVAFYLTAGQVDGMDPMRESLRSEPSPAPPLWSLPC